MTLPIRPLVALLLAFAALALTPAPAAAQSSTPPKLMPAFQFVRTTGQLFTRQNLAPGKATLIVFFDPFCDHCQTQATWIKNEVAKFATAEILWVSTEESAAIAKFQSQYFPGNVANIHFLKDKDYKFDEYFGYSEVPTMLVYDSKGNFVMKFTKETSVAELMKLLK